MSLFVAFCSCDELHQKQKTSSKVVQNVMEESMSFWKNKAQNYVTAKKYQVRNINKAKNIILFIGDGMSIPTVAATRMYMGKEENDLSFDTFPYYGLAKTYCVDTQTADSACTATAYLSGVKTNSGTINVNAKVLKSQCEVSEADHVYSIAKWAQESAKAAGVVTTTRITHASPAGVYASTSDRDWEDNTPIEKTCKDVKNFNVKDIAQQLVYNEVSKNLRVVLGGGRKNFINATETDEEGRPGTRTDGRNLINEWMTERNQKAKAKFIWHKQQLNEIDFDKTDYLMGLFESDHCMYNLDILNNNLQNQEPSLTDMTVAAIKMLQKEENGFFLFVEGGRIDHAHHDTKVQKALEETKEFSRAIEFARKMTSESDTLIVVSSDHSHTMSYSGYADRRDNILATAGVSDKDGKPYETLSYANGPGYDATFNEEKTSRVDISSQDFKNPDRVTSATVPLQSETHAAEDVGVYSSGPWAHLFTGNYEQNNIPLLMAYAAKIGPFDDKSTQKSEATKLATSSIVTIILVLITSLVMRS